MYVVDITIIYSMKSIASALFQLHHNGLHMYCLSSTLMFIDIMYIWFTTL